MAHHDIMHRQTVASFSFSVDQDVPALLHCNIDEKLKSTTYQMLMPALRLTHGR